MRIFDLDTLLSFAFYPDGNKKRDRNSQEYRLNIDQYGKNGSDEIDEGTIKKHLKNLKVLCLGVANKSDNPQNKLASVKLRIEEKKQYKLKKEFQTPNESNPLPFFLLYKKKKAKANISLTDMLNPFFLRIISSFKQQNLNLKRYGSNKKALINIENTYRNRVKQVAENIFQEIKNERKDITIMGLFIDPYFISEKNNDLILIDTRPTDTLPRKRKHILQEPTVSESNLVEDVVHLNINGSIINDPNSNDESLFLDQLFFEPIKNEIKNGSKLEETDENKFNTELDLSNETSNSVANDTLMVQKTHAFAWNSETKEKIKNLLGEYQKKHLHKSYFFYYPCITKSKQTLINELLNKLDDFSCQSFLSQIRQAATADILNQHRNFFYLPILSYLFNTHSKTKGALLLENIFVNLKEDYSIALSN